MLAGMAPCAHSLSTGLSVLSVSSPGSPILHIVHLQCWLTSLAATACFSPPHLFLLESGAYECVSPRVLRRGLRRGRGHLYPGFNGSSFAMQFFNWESFEKTKTLLVADSDFYWCFTARPVRSNKILDTHFCWCHLIFSLATKWVLTTKMTRWFMEVSQ